MKIRKIVNIIEKFKSKKPSSAELDNIYQHAQSFVEDIPKERFQAAVESVFSTKPEPNRYFEWLDSLKTATTELNCPQEFKTMLSEIEAEAKTLVGKAENISTGSKNELWKAKDEFINNYCEHYKKMADFLSKKFMSLMHNNDPAYKKYYDTWNTVTSLEYQSPIPRDFFRISALPEGIISKDGIVYHGTRKARQVTKEGFSPYRSSCLNEHPREFGAGIYTTPDKRIAAYFARITGRIIPLKADVHNTAFVEDFGFGNMSSEIFSIAKDAGINTQTQDKFNTAAVELISNRLFREAGYDSIYTANGMASGLFTNSIDKYIGRAQSQLVIFDPSKVTIAGNKKLSQKIGDEFLQIKALLMATVNTIKTGINDPLSTLLR